MKRAAGLMIALAVVSGVWVAGRTHVSAQPQRGRCLSPARVAAALVPLKAANRRSFERAARAAGLDPTSVGMWPAARTLGGTWQSTQQRVAFRAAGATEGDPEGTLVAGTQRLDGSGEVDLFARDRAGLWHLVLAEPEERRSRSFTECGCAWHCGSLAARQWWTDRPVCRLPSGVAPLGPFPVQYLYRVPTGATFGPALTIRYRSIGVRLEARNPCPPPP